MGYEVDFLPVGNGDTSGDAITVRWGMPGNYQVMVYDGGTRDSGAAIVGHVKRHYQTTRVDYVVSSHPDADHASGLPLCWKTSTSANSGCIGPGNTPP